MFGKRSDRFGPVSGLIESMLIYSAKFHNNTSGYFDLKNQNKSLSSREDKGELKERSIKLIRI